MTIDKNLSNAEYHAHHAISSSDVKLVASKSLAHWKAKIYKSSFAFDLGSAVHDMVLEGGKMTLRGPEDRRGSKWKDAQDEAGEKLLLTSGDYDLARSMADSILFHPAGRRMAGETTVNEASFFCTDPDIGLPLKARPDSYWPEGGIIYDIKTCQDASPRGFGKDAFAYRYAIQAALYMRVLKLEGCHVTNFIFVCVEKEPPHEICIHTLSPEYLAWGATEMFKALEQIKQAELTGHYTTGWPDINTLHLPKWLEADF